MIELSNISKWYGNHFALKNISIKISRNQITGLLGPNGAGKSTTMDIISGCVPPNTGTISVAGIDSFTYPNKVKSLIGYLPDPPVFYEDMTIWEYCTFLAHIHDISNPDYEILKELNLYTIAHRLIKNLSRGFKQRTAIAATLIHKPDILILDEPTEGLDPKQTIQIRHLLKQLSSHCTILISSHILTEVLDLCTRGIILNNGQIVADMLLEDLNKEELEKYYLSVTEDQSK